MSEKDLDEVYDDRNLLVVALAVHSDLEYEWKPDPENPVNWAIVYFQTKAGQISYHIPKALATEFLEKENICVTWDGYTRSQKNERLIKSLYNRKNY